MLKSKRDRVKNDSDEESEVEKKSKRKHKKSSHSRHEHKRQEYKKRKNEDSSDSEEKEEVVEKVKKSHHEHKKKKKKSKQSSSSESSESSSSSEEERVKKSSHHHKRKKEKKHRHEGEREDTIKQEPIETQERSRHEERRHHHHQRNEPSRTHERPEHSRNQQRNKKPFCDEASEEYEWGKKDNKQSDDKVPQEPKQKPNFGLSGKLTEDTNMYNGVVIKYSEPPDARKPKRRWRLYPFKGETALPVLHIHRQSAFLMGRDRKVADIPVDHPSCSKQHAALQYRLTDYQREDGSKGKRIRLYIIDLESANGTFINNKRIDSKRYVELIEKDVIKFGFSSREYVLLHEHSKDSDEDDDVDDD